MYRGVTALSLLFLFAVLAPGNFRIPELPNLLAGYVGPVIETDSYLFVGDVMMARYVETLVAERGIEYLFSNSKNLFNHFDYVFGNFEGPVTENHTPTMKDEMVFSIATSTISGIGNYFSAMSLANNHTYDHGSTSLATTQQTLMAEGVDYFGHPNQISSSTAYRIDQDGYSIVLHGLHAVEGFDATSTLQALAEHDEDGALQIVYVHWGDEYKATHNQAQEDLAKLLIDGGADSIIGHHPHVVQDIGFYKGVPIFYSLGNFIFDQYFDEAVQTHLALGLVIENRTISYQLIPLTSIENDSSPRLMAFDARLSFLTELAKQSDAALYEQIKSGKIELTEVLASL